MIPLLMSILLVLDPFGHGIANHYNIVAVSPLYWQGVRLAGMATWNPPLIHLDVEEAGTPTFAACVIVHEAAHLKWRTSGEELPLLYQYVCLDRLGASWWEKSIVYERLGMLGGRDDGGD